MRKALVGVIVLVVALGVTAIALAATTKAQPLTAVTVAVDGMHCQACVDELQKDLGKVAGVSEVTVTLKPAQVTAKLDESKISAGQFVNVIAAHPRAMNHSLTYGAKLVAYIDTEMCAKDKKMCDACFTEIPKVLKTVKGISAVALDETGKVASISFAKDAKVTTSAIAKALGASNFKFKVTFATAVATTTEHQHATGAAGEQCDMGTGSGGCSMGSGCGM